jgi:hypothetical protein
MITLYNFFAKLHHLLIATSKISIIYYFKFQIKLFTEIIVFQV